eukprot:UN02272
MAQAQLSFPPVIKDFSVDLQIQQQLKIAPSSYDCNVNVIKIKIKPELKASLKYRKQDPETRYDEDGTRYQCVAIPYRINNDKKIEIFMITSRKRGDYIFPGGGWELNETAPECAQRESWEEAGIKGKIRKEMISDQAYTSDKGNKSRLWGFLMEVTYVADVWPEPQRRRKWMSIEEAELALQDNRRRKFGRLWKKSVQYFTDC